MVLHSLNALLLVTAFLGISLAIAEDDLAATTETPSRRTPNIPGPPDSGDDSSRPPTSTTQTGVSDTASTGSRPTIGPTVITGATPFAESVDGAEMEVAELDGTRLHLGPMPDCAHQPLPARYIEWQRKAPVIVKWTYGNETCNSMKSCFGGADNTPMEPQLLPVHVPPGVQVRFIADVSLDVNFTIRPFWVGEANFRSCDIMGGIPVIAQPSSEEFVIQSQFLKQGSNYFIVETDQIFKCEYGLRLNITVKEARCRGPGEPVNCWNRGRCLASPIQPFFECSCCHGYTGSFCEDIDACTSSPCQHGGTCVDQPNDPSGQLFTCSCPRGTYGPMCDKIVENMCNTLPCENNGTCNGNRTHYKCDCPPGFSGWHCEVNVNECSSNPCVHGVCVDRVNGFQCFCIPGHGGTFCEKEYDECQSSPCKNGGFCIDKEDGWECHCGRGYTGTDCGQKVDLCDPSPCSNATDCVDYGNTFTCTCNPGFTGLHCEININECGSNPCQNGGRCYDEVAAYKCMCTTGHTGPHCEHTIQALLPKPADGTMYRLSHHHHSHLHNLSIIAGTLAGALLIALSVLAGCYCRLYGTYHLFNFRQFKYKRHTDCSDVSREKQDSITVTTYQTHEAKPSGKLRKTKSEEKV